MTHVDTKVLSKEAAEIMARVEAARVPHVHLDQAVPTSSGMNLKQTVVDALIHHGAHAVGHKAELAANITAALALEGGAGLKTAGGHAVKMVADDIIPKELVGVARRVSDHITGEAIEETVKTALAKGEITNEAAEKILGGYLAVGAGSAAVIGAGIETVFAVRGYNAANASLEETYRYEVAEVIGKPPQEVTKEDFWRAVEDNPTLQNAISGHKTEATFKVVKGGVSGAAGVLAGTATGGVTTAITAGVGTPAAIVAGIAISGVTQAGVSYAMDKAGGAVLGLGNGATCCERVAALNEKLAAGQEVTARDVLKTVLADGTPHGDKLRAVYGKGVDELSEGTLGKWAKKLATIYPCEELAGQLNRHEIRPERLAFIAADQISAYTPPPAYAVPHPARTPIVFEGEMSTGLLRPSDTPEVAAAAQANTRA